MGIGIAVVCEEVRSGPNREVPSVNRPKLLPEALDMLQRQTFDYFVHEVNPLNGLVVDKTQEGAPASIAAVGLALSAYPVGVERGFITRARLSNERSRPCGFSGTVPRATGLRQRATRAFIIIFST